MPKPTKSHDLNLPAWGPYSKRYAGIAHIPDLQRGLRFDLSIIPGHYRRQMLIPNEKWASGYHAWEAAPDLSYYAYRYEIEWKDQVYCDVSFSAISEQERLVRCAFVNNTDQPQNLMLHLMASMNFPPVRPYSDEAIRQMDVTMPHTGIWVDALDYDDLGFATPRPTDNLVENGMMRAEIRDHGLTNGSGIGTGFGAEIGDWVTFIVHVEKPFQYAILNLRYRLHGNNPAAFRIDGFIESEFLLNGDNRDEFGFSQVYVSLGIMDIGEHRISFTSLVESAIDLDGFALVEAEQVSDVQFKEHIWTYKPNISIGALPDNPLIAYVDSERDWTFKQEARLGTSPNTLMLQYADTNMVYGVAWNHPDCWIRQILHDELDSYLRQIVPDNYTEVHQGNGKGHFTDVFMRPIFLAPHTTVTVHSIVCNGTTAQVTDSIKRFLSQSTPDYETLYESARQKTFTLDCLPSGESFRFSQERMVATELINVVYPIYTQRQFIRHYTPGKWWDCLYTWDSGFIGLGLLEIDIERSIDNLNAYLTDAGNTHGAFIHHGSPIPVQIYQFLELWNRTQDHALLARFYPSLRQYYLFLAGRLGSSTTRDLPSNLLRTWEYFMWDSGGWDDYPAQIHTLETEITKKTTCSAITAHIIRSAHILKAIANALGFSEDIAAYQQDTDLLSDALQRFAWDDEAGYFSYVVHDDNDIRQLRDEHGVNFNMGLDGIMPLIADVCTPEQETLMLKRLQDPERFWTRIGLSTVDQTAPYYRKDGYWNGSVWMPHQWFIWKTALDLGHGDFAYKIASTALDLWKAEVGESYYCFEHFIIGTGRGAGWHQFGGLSSPVLAWFSAYHRPGRLTTGFNIWVESQRFAADHKTFTGNLRLTVSPRIVTVLVTMNPDASYNVMWNDEIIEYKMPHAGFLQINLPFGSDIGELRIKAQAE
ncbi:MAG: hypothetical protein RLP44_21645 [Aggregatilineales bacterium]